MFCGKKNDQSEILLIGKKGRFVSRVMVFSSLWGRRLEALLQSFSSVPLFVGRENEPDLWYLPAFPSLPSCFMEFLVLY